MKTVIAELTDFDAFLSLAREVEHLFGPMADEESFQEALRQAISNRSVFCIRSGQDGNDQTLIGGVVISTDLNEISWLAVSKSHRGHGYGRALLGTAISKLNRQADILVQTFDDSVPEGKAARKLYLEFGFTDYEEAGLNPAGIPTVIMRLT